MRESISLAILGSQLTIAGTLLSLAHRTVGDVMVVCGVVLGAVAVGPVWGSIWDRMRQPWFGTTDEE